jgi:hypothetical protein
MTEVTHFVALPFVAADGIAAGLIVAILEGSQPPGPVLGRFPSALPLAWSAEEALSWLNESGECLLLHRVYGAICLAVLSVRTTYGVIGLPAL